MSVSLSTSVLETNPYEGHPNLSELEAEVLWQYAKLSQNIKELISETRRVSEAPDEKMLKQLRALEVKMGLVLTLHAIQQFKASVWAVINEQPMADISGGYMDSMADDTVRE